MSFSKKSVVIAFFERHIFQIRAPHFTKRQSFVRDYTILYDAERHRMFHDLSGHLFWEVFSLLEVRTVVESNQVHM